MKPSKTDIGIQKEDVLFTLLAFSIWSIQNWDTYDLGKSFLNSSETEVYL